jgi:hypothetical protein
VMLAMEVTGNRAFTSLADRDYIPAPALAH